MNIARRFERSGRLFVPRYEYDSPVNRYERYRERQLLQAISYVQDVSGSVGSPTATATATFASNITAGNLVVAYVRSGGAGTTPTFTITDGPGDTFLPAGNVWNDATTGNAQQLQFTFSAGGSKSMQVVAANTTGAVCITAAEFRGVNFLDTGGTGAGPFSSGTNVTTTSLTPNNKIALILAFMDLNGATPSSPSVLPGVGSGTIRWNLFGNELGGSAARDLAAYGIVSSASPYNAKFTWTGAQNGDTWIASFAALSILRDPDRNVMTGQRKNA